MAANPIPNDGQAPVNGTSGDSWKPQGSLTELVIQQVNYSNDLGEPEVEIILKGPYKNMKTMADSMASAQTPYTWTTFQQLASTSGCPLNSSLDPLPPSITTQLITSFRLEQGVDGAGVHGTLTVRVSLLDNSGGGGGDQPLANSEVWGLTWQAESWDVYRFCKNDNLPAKHPYDPNSGDQDITGTADSIHIQQFLDQPPEEMHLQGKWNYKSSVNSEVFTLNHAERLIAKKKMAGIQPIYHYPLVTKTVTYQTDTLPTLTGVGELVDCIRLGQPVGCPFTFDNSSPWAGQNAEWIELGDTVNMTRDRTTGITTTTRTWTWMGTIDADINFYSVIPFNHNNLENCRWEFGSL